MDEVVTREGVAIEARSRVQLRAVLSGLAVAAGVYVVCTGIAWAIGLSTFEPTAERARRLAMATMIWGAVAVAISIFCGAYVAALVGRSLEARTGILHGLVVWGASAALIGGVLALFLSGIVGTVLQMSERGAPDDVGARALMEVTRAASLSVWLHWAGIVAGLLTSIAGGWLGARSEVKRPRPARARTTTAPGVAQPAY